MKTQNYNSKLKSFKFLTLVLIFAFCALRFIASVHAQTIDPSVWQAGATGLQAGSGNQQQTAGLTTIVQTSGTPFVFLQGGVKESWGRAIGPSNIELGYIKLPAVNPMLSSQTADWAHNELEFTNNLKITVSRLSPAILIQNQNGSLRLFSGDLNGATLQPSQWAPYAPQITNHAVLPSFPKYIAYSSGGIIRVQPLSSTGFNLPVLENNWILVWYGNNSHFADTKTPYSISDKDHSQVIPSSDTYLADAPILLKFQNNPIAISHSPEGGIDLFFAANAGYLSFLPLYGREHPRALDTEGWSSGLPQSVQNKINFWISGNRLCSYPVQVSETYTYDPNNDSSIISENITYLNVCSGGSTNSGFAILSPVLALAKDALGVNIAGALNDAFYTTEFGPIIGIDNTNNYAFTVSGLKKYTDKKRVLTDANNIPEETIAELNSEVDKLTQGGHLQPWFFADRLPHGGDAGDIYFLNPAENLYYLSDIASVLSEPKKSNLIDYLKNERMDYPPETVYNLPPSGAVRGPFSENPAVRLSSFDSRTAYKLWQDNRPEIFFKKIPLYNFYGLASYYDLTGEPVLAGVMSQAKTVLGQDMSEQDWASFSWFKGFAARRVAVENSNMHLAGVIGFIKLAQKSGDNQSETLGRSLLAKAVISRIAMAKYPRYQYLANLAVLPVDPAWQVKYESVLWAGWGLLFNYSWASSYDDAQQVTVQDQFGTYLYDHSGYMPQLESWARNDWFAAVSAYLTAYRWLVPETFRILTDYAKTDTEIYVKKFEAYSPQWYVGYAEGLLGGEHNLSRPIDSHQIFLAKAWLEKDTPQNLEKYTSFAWLADGGDLFYMHKLAETIKAYQGVKWEDEVTIPGLTGDVNQDALVNVLDVQAGVNHILGIQNLGNSADVNQDGSVDVLDVQVIVNLILGV